MGWSEETGPTTYLIFSFLSPKRSVAGSSVLSQLCIITTVEVRGNVSAVADVAYKVLPLFLLAPRCLRRWRTRSVLVVVIESPVLLRRSETVVLFATSTALLLAHALALQRRCCQDDDVPCFGRASSGTCHQPRYSCCRRLPTRRILPHTTAAGSNKNHLTQAAAVARTRAGETASASWWENDERHWIRPRTSYGACIAQEPSSSSVVEPDKDDDSTQSHTTIPLDREPLEKVRKRCLRGGRMTRKTGFVRDATPWRYTPRSQQERAC